MKFRTFILKSTEYAAAIAFNSTIVSFIYSIILKKSLVLKCFYYTITQPKLIIVHLMGSHYPFDRRTKGQFDVFFHSTKLSHYIQSIRHTDQLLKNITVAAQSTKESWSMLYFSDHGLALEKKFFGHHDNYQENYRVPMFILSSDDTQREKISAYRSALHFPSLFSQWTGIQERSLITDCCYLSNTFCKNQTSVILFNKTKIEISRLAVNPITP